MIKKLNIALTLAVIAAMLITSVGMADDYSIDNDVYSPGNQASVNLTAAPGATVTTSVQIIVDYQGSKHLKASTAISFAVIASQTSLPSPYTVGTVSATVPSNWDDTTDRFVAGSSDISFIAPATPGPYTYTVKWDDSDTCVTSGDCLSGANAFTINLTVTAPSRTNAECTINGYTGTYDGLPHGASGTCTNAGGVPVGTLNFGASFTDVPGGTAHWTFSGGTSYYDQSGDVSIVINKALVTATAGGGSTTYDGFAKAPSACVVSGAYTGSLSCTNNPSSVGPGADTYTIAPVVGGDVQSNFAITLANGSYTIGKASVTVTAGSGSAAYNGQKQSPSPCAVTGVYTGDLSCTNDPASVGPDAATYPIAPLLSGSNQSNFEISLVNGSYTIEKADATCTISGYSGVYDAASHGATGTCSGIGGETAGTLNLGASFTNVPGGTAHWTFTGNGNYKDQSGDVAITISKANATCTVSGYTGVYDATSHGATGSCSGIGGESAGTLDLGASYKDVPGGTAHWTFTGNGNYNDQSGDAAIVITKADALCAISGYTGVYDATPHGATGSCSGIGGESAGTLDFGASFTNVPGGTAHWAFTGNGNYKDQAGDVAITLSKADASCTINGYSGVYDAAFHGAAGTCSGIGGEPAGTLDKGASFKDVPGGVAHWIFTGNGNYNDQIGDAPIVITKADATCVVSGYNGVYDAAFHGAAGTCSGIGGEAAGTLDLGAIFKDVPGGTAHWVFTGNGNYNDKSGDAPIVITKADATCTISGWTGVQDGLPHGATGSCSGIGGESAGTLNLGASFTKVPGGTAHWIFTGNGNYNNQIGDVVIDINFAPQGSMCLGTPGHDVLQPINTDGTSVWKVRNTIPVKFRVCDANGVSIGGDISAVFDPNHPAAPMLYMTLTKGALVPDEVAVSNTPDLAFRWSGDQWIFNLKTDNLSGGKVYYYHIYLADGTTIDFQFGLK